MTTGQEPMKQIGSAAISTAGLMSTCGPRNRSSTTAAYTGAMTLKLRAVGQRLLRKSFFKAGKTVMRSKRYRLSSFDAAFVVILSS